MEEYLYNEEIFRRQGKNNGEVCNGGIFVVPTYQRQFDKGKYAEYVETATSNKDRVVAKTLHIKDKKANYWIIDKNFDKDLDCSKSNCDSVIQSHVTGPLSFMDFKKRTKELGINLEPK